MDIAIEGKMHNLRNVARFYKFNKCETVSARLFSNKAEIYFC